MMNKKVLVFGLGPGRCGTASLAHLLNEQKDSLVCHELFPLLPWETEDKGLIQFKWEQLHHQSHQHKITGEVGTYYLPWVSFLMDSYNSSDYLQKKFNFKFIVLKRSIEEVVRSYVAKFQTQGNNPLQNHDGSLYVKNEWDTSFPKYDNISLEKAVEKYVVDYYKKCDDHAINYPENFLLVEVNGLNDEHTVSNILDFIQIPKNDQRIISGIKKNVTKKQ